MLRLNTPVMVCLGLMLGLLPAVQARALSSFLLPSSPASVSIPPSMRRYAPRILRLSCGVSEDERLSLPDAPSLFSVPAEAEGQTLAAMTAAATAPAALPVPPRSTQDASYAEFVPGNVSAPMSSVPEPGSLSLVLCGGALFGLWRRRSARQRRVRNTRHAE